MKQIFISTYLMGLILILSVYAMGQYPPNKKVTLNNQRQDECAIAVKQDTLFVGWNDYRLGSHTQPAPGFSFSTDGGNNWTTDAIITGFTGGGDPSTAFDRSGYAYYCFVAPPSWIPNVSRTNDLGINWISKAINALGIDKPYMTIDNTGIFPPTGHDGSIYVGWAKMGAPLKLQFGYLPNWSSAWTGIHPN